MRCLMAVCALAVAGCVQMPTVDLQPAYHGYVQDGDRVKPMDVVVGMSGRDATALLGPPAHIACGRYRLAFARHFRDFRPGTITTEWAWRRGGDILVAYLEYGNIMALGVLGQRREGW